MYHDLYIIFDIIKHLKIKTIKYKKKINSFKIFFNFEKQKIIFTYDRNLNKKIHSINNKILNKRKNLILKMFNDLFLDKSKIDKNRERTLFCIKILNRIEKKFNEK